MPVVATIPDSEAMWDMMLHAPEPEPDVTPDLQPEHSRQQQQQPTSVKRCQNEMDPSPASLAPAPGDLGALHSGSWATCMAAMFKDFCGACFKQPPVTRLASVCSGMGTPSIGLAMVQAVLKHPTCPFPFPASTRSSGTAFIVSAANLTLAFEKLGDGPNTASESTVSNSRQLALCVSVSLLDGRNRARVIAGALARVIAAIRIAGSHISPQNRNEIGTRYEFTSFEAMKGHKTG